MVTSNSGFRTNDGGETRVELWHRPMRTGGRGEFDRVVAALEDLSAGGDIDEFAVESWDPSVDVSGRVPRDPTTRRTFEQYGLLRAFDSRCTLDSLPETPTRAGVGRLGPEYREHRVPRAVLFEFQSESLQRVTLCDEHLGALTRRLREISEESVREREVRERRGDERTRERTREREEPSRS